MLDRFLHEGERLLAARKSSPAALILTTLRGLIEGIAGGAVVSGLVAGISLAAFSLVPPVWVYIVLTVLSIAAVLYQRVRMWNEGMLRVTTERILVSNPFAFFHAPLVTIKWPQYQESEVGHRKAFDIFFFARPLWFRYGTADARYDSSFPSLRYAEDLKHYLDKVDAAVRKNDLASLKPFVAKPRGRRD